jgi:hypothetical protein
MFLAVETRSQAAQIRQYGFWKIALLAPAVAELVLTVLDHSGIGLESEK